MTFSHQILAYLAPAVFALALLAYAANRKIKAADLKKFAGKGLFSNASNFKTAFKALLLALGAGSIVFALARPKWGYKWEELTQKGVDIVFAVDTSKSMLAEDLKPNRLERAKLAISDIVDRLKGDRIGLVAFSGQAFLQCPITLDYDAFKMSLDALDTNIIQRGGTNIASALDEAAAALKSNAAEKIIVLISDGEELEASAARKAEEIAKIKGVKIYTLGVGSAKGEPIPVRDEKGGQTLLRDESGKLVSSRLNEKILTDVAKAAGGFYANMANNGMEQIYEEGIEKAQKSDISSKMKKTAVERFQIPLAAALIFLALELLIGTRKIFAKRGLNNSALALAAIIAAGTMHPKDGEASETPPSWTDSYNAGVENFQKGEISKAKDDFYKSIASTQDFSKQADSYYNIGCADYAAAKAAFGKIEKPEQILPEFKNALKQASESLSSGSETLKKGKAALQKGEEFLKEKNLQNEIKQSISACEESKKSLEKSAKSGAETEPKIKGAAAAADSALANFKNAQELKPKMEQAASNALAAKNAVQKLRGISKELAELSSFSKKADDNLKNLVEELKKLLRDDNRQNQDKNQDRQQNQQNQDQRQNQQNQQNQNNQQNQQNQDNSQNQDQQQSQNNQQSQQNQNKEPNQDKQNSQNNSQSGQNEENKTDNQKDKDSKGKKDDSLSPQDSQNSEQNQNETSEKQNPQDSSKDSPDSQADKNGSAENERQNSEAQKPEEQNAQKSGSPDNQKLDGDSSGQKKPSESPSPQAEQKADEAKNSEANLNKDEQAVQNLAGKNPSDKESADKESKEAAAPQKENAAQGVETAEKPEADPLDFRAAKGVMTRREASQILDAEKSEEKKLPFQGYGNQFRRYEEKNYKDW